MPTKVSTSPAEKTFYEVTYTIRDGDHEYSGLTVARPLDHAPNEQECVRAAIEGWSHTKADIRAALRQYNAEGYCEIPGDHRRITDVSCRRHISQSLRDSAAGLLRACEIAQSTYQARLSLLEEEREWRGDDETDDMLGHYRVLLKEVDAAIAKAEGR